MVEVTDKDLGAIAILGAQYNPNLNSIYNIDYSFSDALPVPEPGASNPRHLNVIQQAAVEVALDYFTVANIQFTKVNGPTQGIAFSQVDLAGTGIAGYANIGPHDADVVIADSYSDIFDFLPGSFGFPLLLHEIGHALGLEHPHEGLFTLSSELDNTNGTVMSYNASDANSVGGEAATRTNLLSLQIYDIEALHFMYGANHNYNAGNDIYNIDSGNFSKTIWDGAGNDTIVTTDYTGNVTVDLREGVDHRSSIGDYNLWIAVGANIENITSGSGNDVAHGNALNNHIITGAGNDTIYGHGGSDTINGGSGVDTLHFELAITNYAFSVVGAALHAVYNATTTIITNVENFLFNNIAYTYQQVVAQGVNQAPNVSVSNFNNTEGTAVLASNIISASDTNGDALTYEIWDGTDNNGFYRLDGVRIANGASQTLTQAEFDRLEIVGGTEAGTDYLWVRVSDGELYGNGNQNNGWSRFAMENALINNAPTLTTTNFNNTQGAAIQASSVITAADADGEPLTYEIWDGTDNNGFYRLDGVRIANGVSQTLTQAEFDRLEIVGGAEAGDDYLWIRATDGKEYATGNQNNGWSRFIMSNSLNSDTPTVTTTNFNNTAGTAIQASTIITAADPNGDALTYEVWDGTDNNGFYRLDGVRIANGVTHSLTQAEFDRLEIVGGAEAGNDYLWVRVSDGSEYAVGNQNNGWSRFVMTNSLGGGEANQAPTVTVTDFNNTQGASVLASTVITAADQNGDALTYEIWDGTDENGFYRLDGVRIANGASQTLTQAEFDRLEIVGGTAVGDDHLWIRISDGAVYADGNRSNGWSRFTMSNARIANNMEHDDHGLEGVPDFYSYHQATEEADIFTLSEDANQIAKISHFDKTEDRLDIADLLTDFDPVTDALSDFVTMTALGDDVTIMIDTDGTADQNAPILYAHLEGQADDLDLLDHSIFIV